MILIAILAPALTPQDPFAMSLPERLQAPSWHHWFGLDQNGSDVLSRVIYGARISLLVSIAVVLTSSAIGLVVGSLAGYRGGWTDSLLMRFIDMLHAFPGFLLALTLVAVLGPSIRNVVIAMCVTGWTGYARIVRAEVLHLKNREYVTSAIALGSNATRVMIQHIWPNLAGTLLVNATFGMAGAVMTESGLSFLGLGVPPTTPTWGALLSAARSNLLEAPHLWIFPGLAILMLVLGFNLFADGLRDALDPRKLSN
jgi:peptide/nickel transport system permease protein